jgi:hypothetical protein
METAKREELANFTITDFRALGLCTRVDGVTQ